MIEQCSVIGIQVMNDAMISNSLINLRGMYAKKMSFYARSCGMTKRRYCGEESEPAM